MKWTVVWLCAVIVAFVVDASVALADDPDRGFVLFWGLASSGAVLAAAVAVHRLGARRFLPLAVLIRVIAVVLPIALFMFVGLVDANLE